MKTLWGPLGTCMHPTLPPQACTGVSPPGKGWDDSEGMLQWSKCPNPSQHDCAIMQRDMGALWWGKQAFKDVHLGGGGSRHMPTVPRASSDTRPHEIWLHFLQDGVFWWGEGAMEWAVGENRCDPLCFSLHLTFLVLCLVHRLSLVYFWSTNLYLKDPQV